MPPGKDMKNNPRGHPPREKGPEVEGYLYVPRLI